MAIIIDQRAQLFQALGNVATSAAKAATEGIAEAAKTDSKTVDTALKLFGGFDRNEFENISGQAPKLLVPAVRPPASYEGPAEYFKPLSNTMQDQTFLVPAKDLLQQLEDPRFRMADGLSRFSDNRITQTLLQKEMIINSKPGGDVSLGGLNEKGIIVVDGGKPADPSDMVGSLDSFGKLYSMENTVGKQLQLHEQLDLGAFGRFSAPKAAPLPTSDSPKLDQGLKGQLNAQAATPSGEIKNFALYNALNGTPETVGEMEQMANVLQTEIEKIYPETVFPSAKDFLEVTYQRLSYLKNVCKLFPPNTPPNTILREFFLETRAYLQQFNFFPNYLPDTF